MQTWPLWKLKATLAATQWITWAMASTGQRARKVLSHMWLSPSKVFTDEIKMKNQDGGFNQCNDMVVFIERKKREEREEREERAWKLPKKHVCRKIQVTLSTSTFNPLCKYLTSAPETLSFAQSPVFRPLPLNIYTTFVFWSTFHLLTSLTSAQNISFDNWLLAMTDLKFNSSQQIHHQDLLPVLSQ